MWKNGQQELNPVSVHPVLMALFRKLMQAPKIAVTNFGLLVNNPHFRMIIIWIILLFYDLPLGSGEFLQYVNESRLEPSFVDDWAAPTGNWHVERSSLNLLSRMTPTRGQEVKQNWAPRLTEQLRLRQEGCWESEQLEPPSSNFSSTSAIARCFFTDPYCSNPWISVNFQDGCTLHMCFIC